MCYVGQKEVFAEGSADIEEFLGIKISAKQIENVSHYWGEEFGKLMVTENIDKTERFKQLTKVAQSQLNTLDGKDFIKSLKKLNDTTYLDEQNKREKE